MKKFIKEEICKDVYLMCGYSKMNGSLYYCIIKDKKNNNSDIMFLNRFQFSKMLENCFHSYSVNFFVNDGWCFSYYSTENQSVIDVLDSEFPVRLNND